MSELQMASAVNNAQLQRSAMPTISRFVESNYDKVTNLVLRQLSNYWDDIDKDIIATVVPKALNAIELNFRDLPNKRFFDGENVLFFPHMSIHWMIFLYRLSHEFTKLGGRHQKKQIIVTI